MHSKMTSIEKVWIPTALADQPGFLNPSPPWGILQLSGDPRTMVDDEHIKTQHLTGCNCWGKQLRAPPPYFLAHSSIPGTCIFGSGVVGVVLWGRAKLPEEKRQKTNILQTTETMTKYGIL